MNSNENSKNQTNKTNKTNQSSQDEPTLKERFIEAIKNGELGTHEPHGIITLKQFKQHFCDIETQYVSSFLPAATIEPGMVTMSHTKFVFRVAKGVYKLHPDILSIE